MVQLEKGDAEPCNRNSLGGEKVGNRPAAVGVIRGLRGEGVVCGPSVREKIEKMEQLAGKGPALGLHAVGLGETWACWLGYHLGLDSDRVLGLKIGPSLGQFVLGLGPNKKIKIT